MKILSLFSGIGAYEKALKNVGIECDVVNYCELNPKVSKCYSIIHDIHEDKNLKNIALIDPEKLPDFDLLTFSPPCQDLSSISPNINGEKAGPMGARTGLMWNVIPIIKQKKPKFLIMENVKNLAIKYKDVFNDYIKTITDLGYDCHWAVLNSKDYGIPQNRQRLFMVGVPAGMDFKMPEKLVLKHNLSSFLNIKTNRDLSYTIRVGGKRSGIGDRRNWDCYLNENEPYYLTSRDCLKLMGFSDVDYQRLKDHNIPDSTIYHISGNSVVVNVLEAIFKGLF